MAIVERHNSTTDLTHWHGSIPVNYVYTAGRAGERFFRGLIKGKLVAAKCATCRVTYVPPRTFCEKCFARLEDNFEEVSPRGKVHTYTVCHRKLDGTPSESPIILGVIKINDTDGMIVHYLGGVKAEEIHIGMAVKAVFKPKKERKGSILDIKYFKPEI